MNIGLYMTGNRTYVDAADYAAWLTECRLDLSKMENLSARESEIVEAILSQQVTWLRNAVDNRL